MRVSDKRRKPYRRGTPQLWLRLAGKAVARTLDCPKKPWFSLSLPEPARIDGDGIIVRTGFPAQYWRSLRAPFALALEKP